MVDLSSVKYWDTKHATNANFTNGQRKHIADYLESGGEALVNITNVPATIKGINDVDEVVLNIPTEILAITNNQIVTILNANKIGSYIENGVSIFGKQ